MNSNKFIYRIILLLAIIAVVIFVISKCSGKKEDQKPIISQTMVLTQIESLGNLQVVKYNIQDIIEYQKVRTFLPNSKTALIVVGEVTGCIDLTQIQEGDIVVTGDSVSLILPDPIICTVKVDHSRSRVYNIQFGLWEEAKLIDEAYAYAEKQIEIEAKKMGIAVDCQENADKVLRPILTALGFSQIDIRFRSDVNNKNRLNHTEQNSTLKVIK